MKDKVRIITGIVSGIFGLGGIAYGLFQRKKIEELRKINSSMIEENLALQEEADNWKAAYDSVNDIHELIGRIASRREKDEGQQ